MMFYFYIPEGICFAVFVAFRNMKVKTFYTLEEGHVGRTM
jgi:hypothetical protein